MGYNPLEQAEATNGREVNGTGATDAARAMKAARDLIDSVAYVAKEGDKNKVLAAIDAVLGGERSHE